MTQQITKTTGFARVGQGWGQAKGTFRKYSPLHGGTEGRKAQFRQSKQRKESKYSILFKPSRIRLHGDRLEDHGMEQRWIWRPRSDPLKMTSECIFKSSTSSYPCLATFLLTHILLRWSQARLSNLKAHGACLLFHLIEQG